LTKLPLNPLPAKSISAVPELCRASAEFIRRLAPLDEVLVDEAGLLEDDVAEPVDELAELPVPDVLEVEDELGELDVVVGAVAVKKLFPAPNPTLGA
jgi:hypothetical protein